jgi:pimeloyl-ACP methyl ester carboxylesterase
MNQPAVVKTSLHIPNRSGMIMRADLRHRTGAGASPVVVICHSFMAFKDWGFFPRVAERLAEAGLVTIAFNFSHNGVTGDGNRITDLARFAENTFTRELDDLAALVDALDQGALPAEADPRRLVLLGHSRGGGIAIVHAARDPRVRALVTWSAIATFDRWTPHQKELWRRDGTLPLAKDSTVSPLRLGMDLLRDIEEHRDALDIERAAALFARPWLLLHGREDRTVQLREAEALAAAADPARTTVRILDHVGHLYHAASREEDGYRTLDGIIDASSQWILDTFT